MPRLEITAKGQTQHLTLDRSCIAVGRDSTNDVVLADTKASRQHCRIDFHEGELRVTDLNSHNGTWVGHERIQERLLRAGEIIRIGKTYINVIADPGPAESPEPPRAAPVARPAPSREKQESKNSDLLSFDDSAVAVAEHDEAPSPFLLDFGSRPKPDWLVDNVDELTLLSPAGEPVLLPVEIDPQLAVAVDGLRDLIWSSIWADASAIHIEPHQNAYQLRFRVDGVLHTFGEVSIREARCVVEALRRLCELDPRPEQLAESGRFVVECSPEHVLTYRAHFVSTGLGQRAMLRRLEGSLVTRQLESLGLELGSVALLSRAIEQGSGLVLVCGPSGSGKTTTVFCAAGTIDPEGRTLGVVEAARECPIASSISLSTEHFGNRSIAELLREAIHQDSDVVVVDGIADHQTATVALESAVNGRLIFATMDAPDVCSAITRLLGWGVEAYLIAKGLSIVTSQRLIRTLCPACRRQYEPDAAVLEKRGLAGHPHGAFYDAVGCAKCLRTGFRGQTGVFEVVQFNQALRDAIVGRPGAVELRRAVSAQTNQTLQESAYKQVIDGTTTLPEADRVLPSD
ncbi:hypothetical protein B7486_11435 [cyanobacterium TDX16]|nr:hypothetical protein B7486_11435 [cyanobacterium TDX16]